MRKTLQVQIDDVEETGGITISATRMDEFNPNVVVQLGTFKVVLNSQQLAEALAAVVDFVTPPEPVFGQENVATSANLFDSRFTEKYGL